MLDYSSLLLPTYSYFLALIKCVIHYTRKVTQALEQVLQRRNPRHSLQHHSDKGYQYISATFQKLLIDNGIIGSMRTTSC